MLLGMSVEDDIKTFRDELGERSVSELVQRHITSGECVTLAPGMYFELKNRVAARFEVHISEVLIVGSAKTGFSIAPEKRYRPFGETSDIDVVICSSALFDAFWKDIFDFWARGESWQAIGDFRKYLFRGWMRPDKLPPAASFNRAHEWWEFFRALTGSGMFGPYKIAGALYKSWHFLESYQQKCVSDCVTEEGASG
jgi:hypothetical protein